MGDNFMTPGYKARREAKHRAEKMARKEMRGIPVDYLQTIDLTPKIARLSWVGGKSFKQSLGGSKNGPGHRTEWTEALFEHASRGFMALQLNSLQANTLQELMA